MGQRRQWHPTPVLLPGKSHGWRSLVGCSPWGRQESDMTEQLHFHFSLSCTGEGNGNPLQCSCLGESQGRGAWWAAVDGVAKSRTRLKRLSSSSSIYNGNIHIRNHGQGDKQQTNWGRNHKAGTPNWRCWYFTEAFLTWATLWNMLQVISSTDLLVII